VYSQKKLSLLDTAVKTYKPQTEKIVPKVALVLPTQNTSLRSMNDLTCMDEGWELPQSRLNRRSAKNKLRSWSKNTTRERRVDTNGILPLLCL
jgi:hypothetical protein